MNQSVPIIYQNSNKCRHVKHVCTEGHKLNDMFLKADLYTKYHIQYTVKEHQHVVMNTINYFIENQVVKHPSAHILLGPCHSLLQLYYSLFTVCISLFSMHTAGLETVQP